MGKAPEGNWKVCSFLGIIISSYFAPGFRVWTVVLNANKYFCLAHVVQLWRATHGQSRLWRDVSKVVFTASWRRANIWGDFRVQELLVSIDHDHDVFFLQPVILIHPPSLKKPLQDFRDLITHRTPFHSRGLWMWAGIAPFTAPFAIVRKSVPIEFIQRVLTRVAAIIPNLPFFFCVWRGWSHRRG
jgi:hypothetical protein